MPAGRPSDYEPWMCEEAIDFLKGGYSLAGLAGHLGVATSTVSLWMKKHAEFSDAIAVGRAYASKWWEERLLAMAMGEPGNATVVTFGLKNRAKEEWADVTRTEVNAQIQVEHKATIDPGLLSFEERNQLRALLEAAQARLPAPSSGVVDGEFREVED